MVNGVIAETSGTVFMGHLCQKLVSAEIHSQFPIIAMKRPLPWSTQFIVYFLNGTIKEYKNEEFWNGNGKGDTDKDNLHTTLKNFNSVRMTMMLQMMK